MDYIRRFDIELERDYYYAGEMLNGFVIVANTENIKVRGIRVSLRAKAHVEWKITRGGERKTVKEDQYFIDDKKMVWGKDKHEDGPIPILHRSEHRLPFSFQLPECSLPCSFESRVGTIRYYLRVFIDIPYASPPQGLKYFTIIGPHNDCMDDRYLNPVTITDQNRRLCSCFCSGGPISLEATLERSAYVCGENIKLKCEVQNGTDDAVWVNAKLFQTIEYRINKSVIGLTKELTHKVLEYNAPKVCLNSDRSGVDLQMEFPVDIATVPFRVPTGPAPTMTHRPCAPHVEGGMYISAEFQMGQVYDGGAVEDDDATVLYKPLYPCVSSENDVKPFAGGGDNISAEKIDKCEAAK